MVKGWLKIKEPEDLQTALVRMLNKILSCDDPISHAGRFASLANVWINAKRLELEVGKWEEIEERLGLIEMSQALEKQGEAQSAIEFKGMMKELKEKTRMLEHEFG
jgi:hypothetical protein